MKRSDSGTMSGTHPKVSREVSLPVAVTSSKVYKPSGQGLCTRRGFKDLVSGYALGCFADSRCGLRNHGVGPGAIRP